QGAGFHAPGAGRARPCARRAADRQGRAAGRPRTGGLRRAAAIVRLAGGCRGPRPGTGAAGRCRAVVASLRQHGHVPQLCPPQCLLHRGRAGTGGRTGGDRLMRVLSTLSGGVNAVRPGRTAMPSVDVGLIVAVSALVLFGLLMVYSASIALADGPRYESYGRFYFVGRHAAFIVIGLLAALFTASIPMRIWQKASVPLFILALALLMVVLVPGIGREVNGARRWLPLGPVSFQPSERMKAAILLYAADYVLRKRADPQGFVRGFGRGLPPMALALMLVGVLLLLEPALGAFIVIGAIAVGILFIGGINLKLFTLLLSGVMSSFLMLIWLSPWRRERL